LAHGLQCCRRSRAEPKCKAGWQLTSNVRQKGTPNKPPASRQPLLLAATFAPRCPCRLGCWPMCFTHLPGRGSGR
jgi:hypothetical protein